MADERIIERRGRQFIWLLVFWIPTITMAQTAPSQTESSIAAKNAPVAKCSIEGTVIRASDGVPVKKAVVTALPQQPNPSVRPGSATSDAEGKFLLRDLEPGRYSLMAARTGYARQMYGQRTSASAPTTLTVLPGQQLKDIVFRLLPGAAISGRIVDEDSEPVSGVRIQALRWGYMNGKRQLMPAGGFAQSDDRGEYRMFQLPPGRYYVCATYSGAGYFGTGVMTSYGTRDAPNDSYPPTYYPGVYDSAQAISVEVRGGEELPGINFRLLPTPAVRVRGNILKGGTKVTGDAWVELFPKYASGFSALNRNSTPDTGGTFEFRGVTPGSYIVWAQKEEDGKRYQASTPIEVGDTDVDGLVLALHAPLEVVGHVRIDGSLDLSPGTVRVILAPREMMPMGGGASATVNSELSFTLAGVDDGEYALRMYGLPPDAYISSGSMGNRDVLRDGVVLRGRSEPLQITISAYGGRVEGSVLDEQDQPFSGARVVLVPDETQWKRQDLFKTTSSDQYGKFLLRGVPPGKYKVFAWEMLEDGAYNDSDFLRPRLDQGKLVELSPGSRVDAQLKLIRGDPINR